MPYVQRAAIALAERGVAFERVIVDLDDPPPWFARISPLRKVPLLRVGVADEATVLFESAAIVEYLDDTLPQPLHPHDALERARHRAWIEFGSAVLNDIWRFYTAHDASAFDAARAALRSKFERVEAELAAGPWFAGTRFSLVDALFGPVFRYWQVFDEVGDFRIFDGLPKVVAWRAALAARISVRDAVAPDYAVRLAAYIRKQKGHLATLM